MRVEVGIARGIVIAWLGLCGNGQTPVSAQQTPVRRIDVSSDAAMQSLTRLMERSPKSFPATLAPLLKRLVRQKEFAQIDSVLAAYTVLTVQINPEARVKLERGGVKVALRVGANRLYLVKIINEAGVTAPLRIAASDPAVLAPTKPTGQNSWLTVRLKGLAPDSERLMLNGSATEYGILELGCRERGTRDIRLSPDIGQGTQDIGFRGETTLLLHCAK